MNISGATSSSYALQSSDVGDTIDIVVTATNAGGSGSATSSKTQTVKPPPPANTGAPTISGTAQQGQTLTASNGSWSNSPTSYGHQWQDCSSSCSNISGATGSTYNLQSSDVGDTVDVVVTATNAGGSGSATSAKTATVTAATAPPPGNTGAPTISGTAQQGQTLTASNGSWSNSPTSYGHQWQDCSSSCSNISGATGSTYNLQSSDVGDTIDVVVTATNAGGSGSATSAKTATVTASSSPPSAPSNTSAPVVTGTAQQGNTLTASSGTWTGTAPIDYTYQWQDCSSGACTKYLRSHVHDVCPAVVGRREHDRCRGHGDERRRFGVGDFGADGQCFEQLRDVRAAGGSYVWLESGVERGRRDPKSDEHL